MEHESLLTAGAITNNHIIREAISIQSDKVYDSCKYKECCEDLRVWFSPEEQALVNEAASVRVKKAELIWVFEDVEPVVFNRGYYKVDLKYYFHVTAELQRGLGSTVLVSGLATHAKQVILFGSEGETKRYTSTFNPHSSIEHVWKRKNLPKVMVETVDPIALGAKLRKRKKHHKHDEIVNVGVEQEGFANNVSIPENVLEIYGNNIDFHSSHDKHVLVTLGVFSIIKIIRNVQVLIPSYGYMPIRECRNIEEDQPCSLFSRLKFPTNEFFPPEQKKFPRYEVYPATTHDERIKEIPHAHERDCDKNWR